MTIRAIGTGLVLVAAAACGDDGGARAPIELPAPAAPARRSAPAARVAPPEPVPPDAATEQVALAARILDEGAEAIPVAGESPDGPAENEDVVSPRTLREFLASPSVDSAVQFGCSVYSHPAEDALATAMEQGSDAEAVVALAALIRVRAPRDVESAWRTLCRLDLVHRDEPGWGRALAELRRPFAPTAIAEAIRAAPPGDRFGSDPALEWPVRAAGVTRCVAAIPRLIELSRGEHLDVSLAAERSLEDFPGPAGDRALVECLVGWRYDAFGRAGRALDERNPDLLERTLLAASVPDDARRDVGLMLARLRNAAAVPHLCATVGHTAMVDDRMFDAIEKLATDEQFPLVEALPASVRDEQRARATSVVAAVRTRLGR